MFSRLRDALRPAQTADAHSDIPCGVYDPQQARIEAESCYRIIEKYNASSDDVFRARCLVVKEERAELTKHHIDVMWHDYFKPEHVEKFPDLHETCWKASKQASQVKRTVDIAEAQKLLDLIDQIDNMWRETGGAKTTRMQAAAA
jgi:nickel superoxide dismutase